MCSGIDELTGFLEQALNLALDRFRLVQPHLEQNRPNRDLGRQRFGDAGYAWEEVVAKLGFAFLCANLRITPEIRDDHAAYLSHWLNVLKEDKRTIFSADAHAQPIISTACSPNNNSSRKRSARRPRVAPLFSTKHGGDHAPPSKKIN